MAERDGLSPTWVLLELGPELIGAPLPQRDCRKTFDSSIHKGVPSFFRLDQVIAGWREGIPMMVEGETRRFWIPKKLAYRGEPGKPDGMLVFDVKLVKITKP